MTPPTPGLRTIVHDARSAAKVQITVNPGDTLTVSDDVADQLLDSSPQFKEGQSSQRSDTETTPTKKKRPARKRAAKS